MAKVGDNLAKSFPRENENLAKLGDHLAMHLTFLRIRSYTEFCEKCERSTIGDIKNEKDGRKL